MHAQCASELGIGEGQGGAKTRASKGVSKGGESKGGFGEGRAEECQRGFLGVGVPRQKLHRLDGVITGGALRGVRDNGVYDREAQKEHNERHMLRAGCGRPNQASVL